MATLAIGLAGAALGSTIGIGANFGFLIGSTIGRLLFPPPTQEIVTTGPRLGDLSVSSSAYGQAIPLGYGTIRLSGNMIWSSGIREVEERREVGGGGGKGGLGGGGVKQTQVTYTYFSSFALGFAATEADDVTRIWADGKLIFDKTSTQIVRKSGLQFRFYEGTETQLPDSLIEADKGSGQVPGHRGLCYIVFDDLKLTDFGNRIPNITAEIAFRATTANSAAAGTTLSGDQSFQTDTLAVDFLRRRVYLENTPGDLRIFNLDTLNEFRRITNIDLGSLGTNQHAGRFTGNYYSTIGGGNAQPVTKRNPETFAETGRFGVSGLGLSNTTTGFGASKLLCEGEVFNPLGGNRRFLAQAAQFDDLGLLDADTMEYIWHLNQNDDVVGINTPFQQQAGSTFFYYVLHNGGNNSISIAKLTVSAIARFDTLVNATLGVDYEIVDTITSATWGNDGQLGQEVAGPAIDQEDGGLIFIMDRDTLTSSQIFKWIEGQGVVWSTQLFNTQGIISPVGWSNNSIIDNGRVGWIDAADQCGLVDTETGEIIIDGFDASTLNVDATVGMQFWDSSTEAIVTQNTGIIGGPVARIFLDRATGLGVTLSSIVSDISARAGFDTAVDLDVSALTDTVKGYVIGRQMTYRQAIEPLASAFFFEGVESDDRVKFPKRGQSSVVTIPQSELVRLGEDGELVPEQRIQEVELPERVSVLYLDKSYDYQQGTQSTKRVRQPVPAMRSRVEETVPYAIVFDATEAEQISEKLLFSAWNERVSYRWRAPQEYLVLDPTDVVTVSLDSGATLEARLAKVSVGTTFEMDFDAVRESAVTFSSTATADGGLGVPQKLPPSSIATRLFQFNIPLLRDIDDAAGAASRSYFAMNGFVDGWSGGALLQSQDSGVTFEEISRALTGVPWGVISNQLPSTSLPFQIDTTTVLNVFMQVGDLQSVTEAQFLADTNVAIVGSPDTNVWEIIAYQNATESSDGVYTVDTLIRAKRGTDPFVNSHAVGEFFIPITSSTVFAHLLTIGQLNTSLPYKGVNFSDIPENVGAQNFTGLGRDLMPYAPAQLAAVLDGGNNIDFSWVRRTRLGGELRDGTGTVPLGETAELYEVDVKDGPGGTVLRTLGSGGTLSTPSVQYDNADIITDFGSVPATITFDVYQISGVVGRGFAAEATITL